VSAKFAWQAGDLEPGWFALVDASQRGRLTHLLASASRSREEMARHMLSSPPWPTGEEEADARARAVIDYLEAQ
jgi:hypothetical protein